MAETIRVEGAARLERTLDGAADELGRLDKPNASASSIVAAAARARAPRRTGRLALSVRAEPSEGAGRVVVGADYAGYVEYGVPSRSIPARPFLAEAVEATRPAWEEAYADGTRSAVSQVKGA